LAATRVHILAKELGVQSKAIVEKCQAEGLDMVVNHMSVISAGLAATITEWFSEGEHTTTAIESSKPVDLKKVRVKRKKTTDSADVSAEETEEISSVAELPEQAETSEESQSLEAPVSQPESESVIAEPETMMVQDSPAFLSDQPDRPVGVHFVVPQQRPEDVVPAGPMLGKPAPVKLSGPKVIRVESPDVVRPGSRAKPRPVMTTTTTERPRFKGPTTTPLMPKAAEPVVVGKGKKIKSKVADVDTDAHKGKKKLRDKDRAERLARIEAADGGIFRGRPSRKIASKKASEMVSEHKRAEKITVTEPITVKDLGLAMGAKVSDIITKLFKQGLMATANQIIPIDIAEMIALEFGVELVIEQKLSAENEIEKAFADRPRNNLVKRATVVTMLGHVDHGKTSLLDRIRQAKVAQGEAGGITQHIGAYQVEWGGKRVTFLDTPGHAAFTAMRARGANMTDVVVLVVAADDGVMPQTIEAIHHAKAAGVTIIVALNKIDLPGVDVNRIYGQLAEHDLVPTEWGGKTEVVKTSATTGEGIEELLEYFDYTSELLDLKADPTIPATGWVVEAKMTQGQGPVATLLVKEGELNKGDIVLVGQAYGRVRTIRDSKGKNINKAISSMPVEVSGLNAVPQAGDKFYCLDDINKAKQAAEQNEQIQREKSLYQRQRITLDNLFNQIEAGKIKELNLVLKADVQGSVDVLLKYLNELSTDEVKIKILHAAVGGINEGDVILAKASSAIIIGFNVVSDDYVRRLADEEGVDIRLYTIIYRITEDLKKAMSGLLEPEEKIELLGRLVVRNTFKVTGVGTIAGSYVTSGIVKRSAKIRLIRDSIIIKDSCTIESLKHFKDDAREVRAGFECGIKIANFDDVKIDDVIEAFEIVKVARTI
jgi:translation initiation factor IF-2